MKEEDRLHHPLRGLLAEILQKTILITRQVAQNFCKHYRTSIALLLRPVTDTLKWMPSPPTGLQSVVSNHSRAREKLSNSRHCSAALSFRPQASTCCIDMQSGCPPSLARHFQGQDGNEGHCRDDWFTGRTFESFRSRNVLPKLPDHAMAS